jgi:hypothetical protein
MILGSCPYCEDGVIVVIDKEVRGKKVKLFRCSNVEFVTEDGELYEKAEGAKCSFQIWQNSLARYGKWLHYKEVKAIWCICFMGLINILHSFVYNATPLCRFNVKLRVFLPLYIYI